MEKGGQKSPLVGREKNLGIRNNNVEPLTKGLIDYLEVSDQDFKGDLTAKICSIVEKISPDKLWYIDQMLKVLCEVESLCKRLKYGCLVVITNALTHGYYSMARLRAIQTIIDQKQLLGLEYGALENMGDCWFHCVTWHAELEMELGSRGGVASGLPDNVLQKAAFA
ncbi:AP-1 complex subunit gamma-2-like protein [Tanacetum coccineum]